MQQEANSRTLIFAFLIALLLSSSSSSVQSSYLASSPSPSPAVAVPMPNDPGKRTIKKGRRGSFPATCHSKCDRCEPCMPVQVSVRAMTLEENEYYPQVWRCACGDNIFSP